LLIRIQAFAESRYIPDPDIEKGILSKIPVDKKFLDKKRLIFLLISLKMTLSPREASSPTDYRDLSKQEIVNLFLYLETNLACLHPDFHVLRCSNVFIKGLEV
jgi:hypothetical protein